MCLNHGARAQAEGAYRGQGQSRHLHASYCQKRCKQGNSTYYRFHKDFGAFDVHLYNVLVLLGA